MDKGLAIVLTAVVGGLVALQAPINSQLGKSVGSFQAATISFLVGTVALATITGFASGGFSSMGNITSVPWYYALGGLLGACYVATVLVTVRTLGAGGLTATIVTGQLAASVLVDRFGWLGIEAKPISVSRIVGLAMLAAGTYLVVAAD